jgi:protein-S-isoprenylcysteine O-methyltransferase Ste14
MFILSLLCFFWFIVIENLLNHNTFPHGMTLSALLKHKIKLYFAGIFLYGLGIFLFRTHPYYLSLLHHQTHVTLLYFFLGYIVIAPFYYTFYATQYSESKPFLLLRGVWNMIRQGRFSFHKEEKIAGLFILVKLFFLPLMINFFWQNFNFLTNSQLAWFPLIITSMFVIDTLIFSLGYTFEFRSLKNIVKSVEPTFFGWAVALISYPPFNSFVGSYVSWGANDYVQFWNPTMTMVMRVLVIFLFGVYLAATISLGPKASNLTNRGIVTRFPYSIVRHPAYISKNLVWWLTLLPVLNVKFALGMFFWTVIYFFRAITEERHLSLDPEYVEYKKKVKWKFIPGVW